MMLAGVGWHWDEPWSTVYSASANREQGTLAYKTRGLARRSLLLALIPITYHESRDHEVRERPQKNRLTAIIRIMKGI
jgi:hypothetical protein